MARVYFCAALAQLVERHIGNVEVPSSTLGGGLGGWRMRDLSRRASLLTITNLHEGVSEVRAVRLSEVAWGGVDYLDECWTRVEFDSRMWRLVLRRIIFLFKLPEFVRICFSIVDYI